MPITPRSMLAARIHLTAGAFDGVTSNGNPGGSCATCPYNQFGSGEGQSKACKNRRMIYILMEGELFPKVLSMPTGSLKEFTQYLKRQLSKGRKLNQIVTKISPKKANSGSGIAFSQAVFTFDRVLNTEEKAAMAKMTESVKAYAANLTTADFAGADDDVPFVDAETVEETRDYIGDAGVVAFDYATAPDDKYRDEDKAVLDPAKSHIVTMSLSAREHTGFMIPVAHKVGKNIDHAAFFAFLTEFLMNSRMVKVAQSKSLKTCLP